MGTKYWDLLCDFAEERADIANYSQEAQFALDQFAKFLDAAQQVAEADAGPLCPICKRPESEHSLQCPGDFPDNFGGAA